MVHAAGYKKSGNDLARKLKKARHPTISMLTIRTPRNTGVFDGPHTPIYRHGLTPSRTRFSTLDLQEKKALATRMLKVNSCFMRGKRIALSTWMRQMVHLTTSMVNKEAVDQ